MGSNVSRVGLAPMSFYSLPRGLAPCAVLAERLWPAPGNVCLLAPARVRSGVPVRAPGLSQLSVLLSARVLFVSQSVFTRSEAGSEHTDLLVLQRPGEFSQNEGSRKGGQI